MQSFLRQNARRLSHGLLRQNLSGVADCHGVQVSTTERPRWVMSFVGTTYADDTHDDFKPKVKKVSSDGSDHENVDDMIARDVAAHGVFVYMKGQPTAPMCGFSNMACRILDAYNVEYGSRDVLADPVLREGIKAYTSWPTIPQIFIGGDFVGGSDILMEMHTSGELTDVLEKVSTKSS